MTTQAVSSVSLSDSSVTTGGSPSAPPSTSDVGISLDDPFTGGMRRLAHMWTTHVQATAETTTVQESAESSLETAPEISKPVPTRLPTDLVVGLKKWTGVIQQVEEDIFTAELSPLDHEGPTLLADFELELLAPDEINVAPGDVIYLTTRFIREGRGYRTATTQVRLRRLGRWSEVELTEIREAARRDADDFSKYVD